jgi:hypothetical protein
VASKDMKDRFRGLGLEPPGGADQDVELAWHETVRNIFEQGHPLRSKLKKQDHEDAVAFLAARGEEV